MLIKAVLLFLLAMVALAMVGNLLFPGVISRQVRRRLPQGRRCGQCGRPMIGRSCDCKKKVG